jgi:hypothetical protein
MVGLDAEVKKAEAIPRGRGECASDGAEESVAAKRRYFVCDTKGDVCWTTWIVGRAVGVGNRSAAGRRFAPCTATASTPGAGDELELLMSADHLAIGRYYIKLTRMSRGSRDFNAGHRASVFRLSPDSIAVSLGGAMTAYADEARVVPAYTECQLHSRPT